MAAADASEEERAHVLDTVRDEARRAFGAADEDEGGWLADSDLGAALGAMEWPHGTAARIGSGGAEHAQHIVDILLPRMEQARDEDGYVCVDEFVQLALWFAEEGSRVPGRACVGTEEALGPSFEPKVHIRALVLAAVLGGAWELPPDLLLRTSSGACRPYQYTGLSAVAPEWWQVAAAPGCCSLASSSLLQEHSCTELERWVPATTAHSCAPEVCGGIHTYESKMAKFWVHRLTLVPTVHDSLTTRLRELALRRSAASPGIEISNAGGSWHSGRDLFRWTDEPAVGTLAHVCLHALRVVQEKEEAEAGRKCTRDHVDSESAALAALQQCDAWLNVSHGQGWCAASYVCPPVHLHSC